MGYDGRGQFAESRFQQLIPARYLPAGSHLTGLSFLARGTGTIEYEHLRIRVGFTKASSLGADFDKNLSQPTTFFEVRNYRMKWANGKTGDFSQGPPFSIALNGDQSLIIDIQKIVKSATKAVATTQSRRMDLPLGRYSFGRGSTTSATATHAMPAPVQIWIHTAFVPTLQIQSDRATTGARNVFPLGGQIDLWLSGSQLTRYLMFVGTEFQSPVSVPGFHGKLFVKPLTEFMGPAQKPTSLRIPNLRSLAGKRFVFQALVESSHCTSCATPRNVSNAVDCIIRP